jgi:hypothetical protein
MVEAAKPKIGVIDPFPYLRPALEALTEFEFVYLMPEEMTPEGIAKMIQKCKDEKVMGIQALVQRDVLYHQKINEGLGNFTISKKCVMHVMNKWLMRKVDPEPFWFDFADYETETKEQIKAKVTEWPFMLKHTSLSRGRGIVKIKTPEELDANYDYWKGLRDIHNDYIAENHVICDGLPEEDVPKCIPPLIMEHLVDIQACIEYCYEGYVTKEGEIIHYGITEEVFMDDHQTIGCLTPPISCDQSEMPEIEGFINGYMKGLIDLGFKNMFFNIELWKMGDKWFLTEINPRMAHPFYPNYMKSFGINLIKDNVNASLLGKNPEKTPWDMWKNKEPFKYTLDMYLTMQHPGLVGDHFDYDFIKTIEDEGILVRHIQAKDKVLDKEEVTLNGVTCFQLWIVYDTKEEVIAKELDIRKRAYVHPQETSKYPAFWKV